MNMLVTQTVIDYRGWKIVIARNYGNTTVNAYTTTPPVQQLRADDVESIKTLIDGELAA